jgi:hypothetical protein
MFAFRYARERESAAYMSVVWVIEHNISKLSTIFLRRVSEDLERDKERLIAEDRRNENEMFTNTWSSLYKTVNEELKARGYIDD